MGTYESSVERSRWNQQEHANMYQLLSYGLTGDKVALAMEGHTDKNFNSIRSRAYLMKRWLENPNVSMTKALRKQFVDAAIIPHEAYVLKYIHGWVEEPVVTVGPNDTISVVKDDADIKELIRIAKKVGAKSIQYTTVNINF